MSLKTENVTISNVSGELESDPNEIIFGDHLNESNPKSGTRRFDVDRYTDSEARTAVKGSVNVEDLTTAGGSKTVPVSDGAGNLTMSVYSHDDLSNVSSADHHSRYTDSEARNAVTGNVNVENLTTAGGANTVPVSDGAGGLTMSAYDHDNLTGVSSADHHSRYTDSEARNAVTGNVNVEDLTTAGAAATVPVSDGAGGLSMSAYSHNDLTNVATDDHHAKYTDTEAQNAVIGSVNVEDLVTTGSSGTVPQSDGAGNLTMEDVSGGGGTGGRFFNSPFYALSDGDYETIGTIRVGSSSSIDIQEVGVQNDLNNIPTGLKVEIQDVTNGTTVVSKNAKLATGSPLASLSGAADFEVRVRNDTGSTQAGSAFASAEGASSGSTDRVDVLNTASDGTEKTVQSDAPALDFKANLVASWDSTNSQAEVDLSSTPTVDKLNGVNGQVLDYTTSGEVEFGSDNVFGKNLPDIYWFGVYDGSVVARNEGVSKFTRVAAGEYKFDTTETAPNAFFVKAQTVYSSGVKASPNPFTTEIENVDSTTFKVYTFDSSDTLADPSQLLVEATIY